MAMHNPPLVAHVIYSLTTGGLENGLVNIINRTPDHRYKHIIICITEADEFAERITGKGVEIVELKKRPGHDFGFYRRLWVLFRRVRPDIIHSRNLAALETQLLSIGCHGVKRVHGEHGREGNDLHGTNWKYLTLRKFMRVFIHRYITVSRDLEDWLKRIVMVDPEKVRQIYNGVDYERFFPCSVKSLALLPTPWRSVDGILVVGTVGRLAVVKDQRNLIYSVAELRRTVPSLFHRLRVIIVGDGPQRQALAALIEELSLTEAVWLTGNRADVPALLRNMDVFVLPSLSEGISNTVLEAMACGLPVIATAVGGNVELIEDGINGRLVPVADPKALEHTLASLLQSVQDRVKLGAKARQLVCERFDWNSTVESYLRVYDELLHSGASGPGTSWAEPKQNVGSTI